MPIPYQEADRIFTAPKRVVSPLSWVSIPVKNGLSRLQLFARLEIDGGIPRGASFRVISHPESLVRMTYQLEAEVSSRRSRCVLYRLELDPRPHTNMLYGPDDINGVHFEAGVPHEHIFYDSLTQAGELRKKSAEQARRVPAPFPGDFTSGLLYVCNKIGILNPEDVPEIPTQGSLL